ncbi:hypothetical protein BGZ83_003422 [Gryganskiella cystojenkinii]|nr:hypothetical protein BGZ83_003422 [Gryganskiella cystojenkinii]
MRAPLGEVSLSRGSEALLENESQPRPPHSQRHLPEQQQHQQQQQRHRQHHQGPPPKEQQHDQHPREYYNGYQQDQPSTVPAISSSSSQPFSLSHADSPPPGYDEHYASTSDADETLVQQQQFQQQPQQPRGRQEPELPERPRQTYPFVVVFRDQYVELEREVTTDEEIFNTRPRKLWDDDYDPFQSPDEDEWDGVSRLLPWPTDKDNELQVDNDENSEPHPHHHHRNHPQQDEDDQEQQYTHPLNKDHTRRRDSRHPNTSSNNVEISSSRSTKVMAYNSLDELEDEDQDVTRVENSSIIYFEDDKTHVQEGAPLVSRQHEYDGDHRHHLQDHRETQQKSDYTAISSNIPNSISTQSSSKESLSSSSANKALTPQHESTVMFYEAESDADDERDEDNEDQKSRSTPRRLLKRRRDPQSTEKRSRCRKENANHSSIMSDEGFIDDFTSPVTPKSRRTREQRNGSRGTVSPAAAGPSKPQGNIFIRPDTPEGDRLSKGKKVASNEYKSGESDFSGTNENRRKSKHSVESTNVKNPLGEVYVRADSPESKCQAPAPSNENIDQNLADEELDPLDSDENDKENQPPAVVEFDESDKENSGPAPAPADGNGAQLSEPLSDAEAAYPRDAESDSDKENVPTVATVVTATTEMTPPTQVDGDESDKDNVHLLPVKSPYKAQTTPVSTRLGPEEQSLHESDQEQKSAVTLTPSDETNEAQSPEKKRPFYYLDGNGAEDPDCYDGEFSPSDKESDFQYPGAKHESGRFEEYQSSDDDKRPAIQDPPSTPRRRCIEGYISQEGSPRYSPSSTGDNVNEKGTLIVVSETPAWLQTTPKKSFAASERYLECPPTMSRGYTSETILSARQELAISEATTPLNINNCGGIIYSQSASYEVDVCDDDDEGRLEVDEDGYPLESPLPSPIGSELEIGLKELKEVEEEAEDDRGSTVYNFGSGSQSRPTDSIRKRLYEQSQIVAEDNPEHEHEEKRRRLYSEGIIYSQSASSEVDVYDDDEDRLEVDEDGYPLESPLPSPIGSELEIGLEDLEEVEEEEDEEDRESTVYNFGSGSRPRLTDSVQKRLYKESQIVAEDNPEHEREEKRRRLSLVHRGSKFPVIPVLARSVSDNWGIITPAIPQVYVPRRLDFSQAAREQAPPAPPPLLRPFAGPLAKDGSWKASQQQQQPRIAMASIPSTIQVANASSSSNASIGFGIGSLGSLSSSSSSNSSSASGNSKNSSGTGSSSSGNTKVEDDDEPWRLTKFRVRTSLSAAEIANQQQQKLWNK